VTKANASPILASAIPDQAATEDGAFSFAVPAASFTDPNSGDTLAYSASRLNGVALPSWLTFNPATRIFNGTPLNGDVGTVSVKVTATDTGGLMASDTFDVTVFNANDAPALTASLPDRTIAEDAAFSYTIPAGTFTDVDAGDILAYSATRGNGTALPSWLTFNPATRSFGGTPLNSGRRDSKCQGDCSSTAAD
jgi:hypothetical protein